MRLIDVHSHIQLSEYDADRADVLQRALDQGIGTIVVGTTLVDSVEAADLAKQHADQPVYASVGIHPTDGDLGEVHPAQLAALLNQPKVVAVGECGLDYHRLDPDDHETRLLQADVFEQHLLVAAQANKPLIIHTRDRNGVFDAYDHMLALLTRHGYQQFVMHCYGGDWVRAEKFLELGGYISITGIATFPKADMLHEVIKNTPLDRLLVETDAPFLTPVPHRGERNEPAYVQLVAETVASIRGISVEDVAVATTANAIKLFGLPALAG